MYVSVMAVFPLVCCSYLCNRATPKFISCSPTIHKVVEASKEVSTQDFLALCSGQFETQKGDAKSGATNSSSTGVRGLLGLPSKRGRRSSVGQQVRMSSDDTQVRIHRTKVCLCVKAGRERFICLFPADLAISPALLRPL